MILYYNKKFVKSILYILCFLCVTFLFAMVFQVGFGTNPNGEVCDYNVWQYGVIYQWVWHDMPCVFSVKFYILYIFWGPIYFLYDYLRKKILSFSSVIIRAGEFIFWIICNWLCLLSVTMIGIDGMLLWTSFLGVVLFWLPIVIITESIHYVVYRKIDI